MNESYLEIAFRHGRAISAHLHLPRRATDKSVRTRLADPGLAIDPAWDGRPIGVEITAPHAATVAALNRVLRSLGAPVVTRADIAPLRAA